jgi:phosphoserine phosphatase RsbU/P
LVNFRSARHADAPPRDAGDAVTLAVHNGGTPIPPEALPFIFEPLARGQAEKTAGGIGLRLFIARAVVSAHRGEIALTSSSDDGTTFTVRLPKRNSIDPGALTPRFAKPLDM